MVCIILFSINLKETTFGVDDDGFTEGAEEAKLDMLKLLWLRRMRRMEELVARWRWVRENKRSVLELPEMMV